MTLTPSPLPGEERDGRASRASAANERGSSAPGEPPRVLLVDDDEHLREALRDLLEDEGLAVLGEAGDGATAVEMARRLRPDVVIMDNRMPVMEGIEATRRIRALLPATRVIFLTAYNDPSLSQAALQAGASHYLVKGCPPAEITEKIRDTQARRWSTGPPA